MNAATDAIGECVERFVREILALIEQLQAERRPEVLEVVAGMLGGTERPVSSRKATSARSPTKAAARKVPAARAPKGASPPRPLPVESPQPEASSLEESGPPTVPSPFAPAIGTEVQKNEREAVVLAAVRALVRATAGEVAAHTGHPNGSVSVALRALGARGHVVRTETARGIEYALVSTAATLPAPQPPPASDPSPPPVALPMMAPKRRARRSDAQLSLFDLAPPEPEG